MWSYFMCMYVAAVYSVPSNGEVDCNSVIYIKLTSCDPDYMLQGSGISEVCHNSGSGSGGVSSCVPLNCSTTEPDNATILPPCNITYQCNVSCDEGFTRDDVTYLCNVTSNSTMVDWLSISGVDVMCERGLIPPVY